MDRAGLKDKKREMQKEKAPLRRLPDAELEIMKELWAAGEPLTRAALEQRLTRRQWSSTTPVSYTHLVMEHYLDNSATTKVSQKAAEKAFEIMTENYGNPSSLHLRGMYACLLYTSCAATCWIWQLVWSSARHSRQS